MALFAPQAQSCVTMIASLPTRRFKSCHTFDLRSSVQVAMCGALNHARSIIGKPHHGILFTLPMASPKRSTIASFSTSFRARSSST